MIRRGWANWIKYQTSTSKVKMELEARTSRWKDVYDYSIFLYLDLILIEFHNSLILDPKGPEQYFY